MNWATIFQYAPKLALALLIIIGVLIVVEIVNMIREKQPKPKETNATAYPENLQPIKFDEQPALILLRFQYRIQERNCLFLYYCLVS